MYLENLFTTDYVVLLEKHYGQGKNNFAQNETVWSLTEYKNAIRNYPFIVLQFGSTHVSTVSPLFNNNNTRLYVSVSNPGGETTIFQIAEYGNNIQVSKQYIFPYVKCTALRVLGVRFNIL